MSERADRGGTVSGPPSGRATATIVITDMVGSTALRSRLGDTVADRLRRLHDDALAEVVARHGGRIVKGTGDGVIAAFDSVTDALDGATSMQAAMARLRRHRHEQPPIRIGIGTGDVVWEDGDCFGMAVVEAARLCDIAEPSQVICSAAVAHLGRSHPVGFTSLGTRSLKGFDAPVEVFEASWVVDRVGDDRSRTLPFVGRGDELDVIAGALGSLVDGAGRVVMIVGEPGIGKSRLVAHATARSDGSTGPLVLEGRCVEHEAVPYAPWAEMLTTWARAHEAVDVAAAFEGANTIGRWVGAAPDAASGETVRTVADLAHELRLVLERIVPEHGLVLFFDDLQWADRGTLELLHRVGPITANIPVTILGTARDTEVDLDHPLAASLARLRRSTKVDHLRLGPLDTSTIAEAVQRLGGRADTTEELVDRIAQETGGNALFVQELLLDLRDRGALADPGSWGRADLPDALRDIVGARIGRLSPPARTLLAAGALRPGGFDPAFVAAAVEMSSFAAFEAVEEAVRAGLVEERGAGYRFTHDLIRRALADEPSAGRRAHLHRAFAALLEDRDHRSPSVVSELIYHHGESGDAIARRRYLIEAGRIAEGTYAFLDAIDLYRRALDISDPTVSSADVRAALARSYGGAGFRLEAARHHLAASELTSDATRASMLRTEAGVNLIRGGRVDEGRDMLVEVAGELGIRIPNRTFAIIGAIALLQTRLGFARDRGDGIDGRERTQLEFCSVAYRGLRHADPLVSALITSRYALLARRSADPGHRAIASVEMAVFHAVGGTRRSAKVDRLLDEARTEAARADDPRVAAMVELVEGTIAFLRGDFVATLEHDERAAKILRSLGGLEAAEQDVASLQDTLSLFWLGRIRDAEAARRRNLEAAEERGDATVGRLNIGFSGFVRLLTSDDPDAVEAGVDMAEASWHQERYGLHHTEALLIRTELALYRGRADEAVRSVEQQADLMKRTMLLRAQYASIMFHDTVARVHLAAAANLGDGAHRAAAAGAIRRIRKAGAPWGDAIADLHEASLAALTDPGEEPARRAEDARRALEAEGIALFAHAAAFRRAQRTEDIRGMTAISSAMRDLGVANPERTVAMLTPGWAAA